METNISPVQESKRLVWIDAARGFAIFGIFIVNIGGFGAPYFIHGGGEDVWTSSIDRTTQWVIDVFFQASFYTLFSLLFGFGFQLLNERLINRNLKPSLFLFRRLFILICFGLIHAFAIWYGDILLTYGLIGLLLLLFLRVKPSTLIIWGTSLLVGSVGLISFGLFAVRDLLGGANDDGIAQALVNYRSGSLITIWTQNYQDWVFGNGGISYLLLVTTLLPLFLFGMYLAQKKWLHEPQKHKAILIRLWAISFVLFIGIKMGIYLFGNPLWFAYIQDNIGGTASAIFYISSITLIGQNNLGGKLIKPLIAVGRMSLTNYIMQSLICFILFYGVGFGLYGYVGPFTTVLIVLLVFIIQIFISKWWFHHFLFGPLEWIWRSLMYVKRQPFRKKKV
ncbi:DUF418 domain-containing protein [Oceanobacillus chungangensis]|uniref:DUF418 domain-containing protein n=1 Tax=Oceanobacillus chungangensis TaxID=1229152 RepID=A0A3D8PX93_9BACI|nr:DUF418 domain-containing protein [Oceanobacillus chungangensis]RDW19931.1 hypothetical protein CWR45_07675 [Oceanobacillus chungangensis]